MLSGFLSNPLKKATPKVSVAALRTSRFPTAKLICVSYLLKVKKYDTIEANKKKMIKYVLQPNDVLIFKQNREGYSFLYNVSPETEKQYGNREGAGGLITDVPVASEGRLTEAEIRAKHARQLGVSEDKLRVLMDAYTDKHEEWVRRIAAVFVRTDALEGILQKDPIIGALKYTGEALRHERK